MSPSQLKTHRRDAFSLIELLLVLVIMGIFAAMAIPSASPSLHDQLEGVARVMAGDIAYARNLAVVNSDTYRLTFDLVNNQYTLTYSGTNPSLATLPASPFHSPSDPPNQQIVRLANLPHLGGSVGIYNVYSMQSPAQAVSYVEFGPLGSTTNANSTVIWFSAGNGPEARYISVRVNPVTGLTWVENFQATAPTLSGS